MVLKILMCRCYKEEFLENGYEYKKKIIHFHCYCDDEHSSYYVLFFKEHPYGAAFGRFAQRGESCQCKKCHDHQICTFCFSVRYLLNFKSFKICVDKLLGLFVEKIITLDQYFKGMNCDPFFYLSKKSKNIEVSLDNPKYGPLPVLTCC